MPFAICLEESAEQQALDESSKAIQSNQNISSFCSSQLDLKTKEYFFSNRLENKENDIEKIDQAAFGTPKSSGIPLNMPGSRSIKRKKFDSISNDDSQSKRRSLRVSRIHTVVFWRPICSTHA